MAVMLSGSRILAFACRPPEQNFKLNPDDRTNLDARATSVWIRYGEIQYVRERYGWVKLKLCPAVMSISGAMLLMQESHKCV
ncbi:MAG: hypothetical protein Q9199_007421 [Rusavskia elegans]